jgi:hypothetical protein
MSDLLATALGLLFTLVVCLLAVHALLSPWLRLRREPDAITHTERKHDLSAAQHQGTTPVHTG